MSRVESSFYYYGGAVLGMYLVMLIGSSFEWHTPLALVAVWVAIEIVVYVIIRVVVDLRLRREVEKEVSA